MQTKNDERVIYLKDLLFSALYRWKRILLFGLILALLLGGAKGLSAYRTISSNATIPQVSEAPERAVLDQRLNSLQATLSALTEYQQESILMQINPYGFYKVSLSAYVGTDDQVATDAASPVPGPAGAILNSYAAAMTDETVIAELSEALEVKPTQLLELITTKVDTETATLEVVVPYISEEGAQIILDILAEQFTLNQPGIAQTVQPHQLSIYQQSVALASDALLAEAQSEKIQATLDLRTAINDTRTALNDATSSPPGVVSVRSLVRSTVIFAIVGLLVGMIIIIAVIWIDHICSNKVYSARTLQSRTQVKVVGCINNLPQAGPVLRKLRALENRSIADPAQQAQWIAANVRNLCTDCEHLLVTGAASNEALVEALKQTMPGVQISVCGSLLTDVAAVDALSACQHVLLVEECEVSRYTDIQQSASLVADNNKQLIGCVLLNG